MVLTWFPPTSQPPVLSRQANPHPRAPPVPSVLCQIVFALLSGTLLMFALVVCGIRFVYLGLPGFFFGRGGLFPPGHCMAPAGMTNLLLE